MASASEYDVAIVGGGIAGLAHAWSAARRKLRTLVLERSSAACGATIRNFGMLWPVGQPAGEPFDAALRSRELWLELHAAGAVDVETCGSIHLARHADELRLQEEFCALRDRPVSMLTAAETTRRAPLANPDRLLAGMWSSTELRVDPRSAARRIARWLNETQGVAFEFSTPIVGVDGSRLVASDGRIFRAERIVICSGSDLQTLFPGLLASDRMTLCKLQMLKLAGSPPREPMPHLASGLTMNHYASFRACPSYAPFAARLRRDVPRLLDFGIHLMASQSPGGEVIFGDSHEYDDAIEPFDKAEIDRLMLEAGEREFLIRGASVLERWHGIYAKCKDSACFTADPAEGVHVFTGLGGAGMTMSFGLAERTWKRWTGEPL